MFLSLKVPVQTTFHSNDSSIIFFQASMRKYQPINNREDLLNDANWECYDYVVIVPVVSSGLSIPTVSSVLFIKS